ncbi:MAG: hypothetical protein R6V29_08190 [Spirochaetia bacterium]
MKPRLGRIELVVPALAAMALFVVAQNLSAAPTGFDLSAAPVVPEAGTLEVAITPAVPFAPSFFDQNAERHSLREPGDDSQTAAGSWWALSYGLEVGYGITPWLGARLKWLPGFTFPSRYSENPDVRRNGASNLRVEVPLLILAEQETAGELTGVFGRAPFSLTVAPVGVVKIRGYDMEKQAELRQSGDAYIAEHPDRKAHAAGLATAQQTHVGPGFSVFAAQEMRFYFPADYEEQSLANYDQNLARAGIEDTGTFNTIDYRYRLAGALGGRYVLQNQSSTQWVGALSLHGHFMPPPIVDDILVENTDRFLISVEPRLAVAPGAWEGKTSIELGYAIPLFGKNEDARNEISLSVRMRFW